MNWHDQFLVWRSMKRHFPSPIYKNMGWKDFYKNYLPKEMMEENKDFPPQPKMTAMEVSWLQEGCPYYKLWPGVFDQFISTRMDIDAQYLKIPHRSFSIYFPDLEEPLLSYKTGSNHFFVRSILVVHKPKKIIESKIDHTFFEAFKILFGNKAIENINKNFLSPDSGFEEIEVRIDFSTREMMDIYLDGVPDYLKDYFRKANPPAHMVRTIRIVPGLTIEQTIGDIVDLKAEGEIKDVLPASIIEACFRIIIGICFVSTGSQKVLEYDVLSRHLEAYRKMREDGDTERCKEYEQRARKEGKFGWNVGPDRKDRHLILPKGVTYDEALRTAGSRDLLYRHTRGGHWHLYWTGEGRKTSIVKWVEETTVRPDLPIRPIRR